MKKYRFICVGGSLDGQLRTWPRARLYRVTPGVYQLQEVYEPVGAEMILVKAFMRLPKTE